MAQGAIYFSTSDMFILERGDGGWSRMAETLMPQRSGSSEKGVGSGWCCSSDGVQVSITIAAKNHAPRPGVLHRKTKGIKLNGTIVIASELTNGKKVANNGWDDKDIVQNELGSCGGKGRLTTRHDRNTSAIAYNNIRMW